MKKILIVQTIKPFVSPQWNIDPWAEHEQDQGEIDALNADLDTGQTEILMVELRGWSPYNAIIRWHDEGMPTDTPHDYAWYLAEIEGE